ncbi:MAG: hypothetical protein Q8M92_01195 [Candidatus Subteraquimicrobiales bacterium]|nr:hypothetical protein [Candidatus Subteraquimicrobiales bacterium]
MLDNFDQFLTNAHSMEIINVIDECVEQLIDDYEDYKTVCDEEELEAIDYQIVRFQIVKELLPRKGA